jgi:hypothetical protein
MTDSSALVLFSGGQDSATCLAWALDRFERVETIGFDYRQRHRAELDSRGVFRAGLQSNFPKWAVKLGEDRVLDLSVLAEISDTALTREVEIVRCLGVCRGSECGIARGSFPLTHFLHQRGDLPPERTNRLDCPELYHIGDTWYFSYFRAGAGEAITTLVVVDLSAQPGWREVSQDMQFPSGLRRGVE